MVGALIRRHPVLVAGLVGCALYLTAASSPTTGFWSHRFYGDSDVYGYYAQRIRDGEVPYRDFRIEYPPGSLVAFVPPILSVEALQHAGVSRLGYTDLFKTSMLLCGLLIVFIVASTANFLWADAWRVLAAVTVVGVSPLVVGPTALSWYDIWPTFLTIAAVALFVRGHVAGAFAVLGIAVAAKLFALVLLPILLLQTARTAGCRRTIIAASGFVATTAAFFGTAAILSLRGATYPFSYLIDRPVEIESTAGSIVGLFHLAGWWSIDKHESFGSVNFEGRQAAVLGFVIAVAGAVMLLLLWWRSALVRLRPTTLNQLVHSRDRDRPRYLKGLFPAVSGLARAFRRTDAPPDATAGAHSRRRSHSHLVPRALELLQQHPAAIRPRCCAFDLGKYSRPHFSQIFIDQSRRIPENVF